MEPTDPNQPTTTVLPEDTYSSDHKNHAASARSFSSDLANAIREKGGSVVRIAIAEDEKHRRENEENSATSKKNLVFIVASILIVLGALGAIYYVYAYKQNTVTTIPTAAPVPSSLVTAEDYQNIDITNMKPSDIEAAINAVVVNPGVQSGTVKNLVITEGATNRIPASQFLSALGTQAPGDFLASLSKQYMVGVYASDENNLFIILQGTSHDYLLSGMLEWEPKLFNDMIPLFNINTSGLTKAQLQSMPFNDLVIENHDTRAVLGPNDQPLFFYSFLDDDTIILATDSKTLTEVVSRY